MKKWIETILPEASALEVEIEEYTSAILFRTPKGLFAQCMYYQKHDFLMVVCSLADLPPKPHFFSFLTSFWKGYAKEKGYSFVVKKLKNYSNLTQEFVDDIYQQFSNASFYDLKSFPDKPYLSNYVREHAYWIFEEKKEVLNQYLDVLNNILSTFEKEKQQNELFSFTAYLEHFWINGVHFSFDEKQFTFSFFFIPKEKVLVKYPHSEKMKQTIVGIDQISDFILNLLTKIKNKNRMTYLFQPPKKHFLRWIYSFRGFSFNEEHITIFYQHFLHSFDGDYLQVEVMSKRLVDNPNLLKSYPIFNGYILYFSILGKHFIIGFNEDSIYFSSVKQEEIKATIMNTVEKISTFCIETDLQDIDSN